MNPRNIVLAFVILLLAAGCKESVPLKENQPVTNVETKTVRPHYYWRQGYWTFSRKSGARVWKEGHWVHKRKHTKWVEGHWVQTARGKMYLEGHWE